MQPLVTVIIISYNCAEYISEAIESCLRQNYKNLEIIIGDDGSKDDSYRIIKEYENKYPTKIKSYVMERPSDESLIIPSVRVSNNIRRALSYSSGEYIRFLSADDYYTNDDFFSHQVNFLEGNKEYIAVAGHFKTVWENGKESVTYLPKTISPLFWSGLYAHISCFLIKKKLFDSKYFLPRFIDDVGMLYSIIAFGKCATISCVGFAYRQRDGSIMHTTNTVERHLLTLLLCQDIMQVGSMKFYTMCRYINSFNYILLNRKKINDKRYAQYIIEAGKYGHDYIRMALNYDNKKWWYKMGWMIFCFIAKIISLIVSTFRKIYYRAWRLFIG